MILQASADDFLAVIEIFWTDEADHAVDEQRIEGARHRIGPRFAGLLIDIVMGVGRQRRALPGLEIHQMIADRAAAERQPGLTRLAQQREIDAEAAVGSLRSRDRLEHQIDRGALPDQSERRGHMGEHAALCRDLQPRDDVVEQPQQLADHRRIVAGRIDADAGVARSKQDAVEDRSRDALGVVEGMVGLQPHAHPSLQADGVAKGRGHGAFLGDQDQILVAHQL